MQALVIRTAGNPAICNAVAGRFESEELRKLRTENVVLRRNRDELKRREMEALGKEIDAYISGRRFVYRIQRALLRLIGAERGA